MGNPKIPSEKFKHIKGTIHQNEANVSELKQKKKKIIKADQPLDRVNYQANNPETLRKTMLLGNLAAANKSKDKIIDVEGVYIAQFDSNGDIVLDDNEKPKYSKLNVAEEESQQNVVWDDVNLCWRFYAVYAD